MEAAKVALVPLGGAVILLLVGAVLDDPTRMAVKGWFDDLLSGRYLDKQIKRDMSRHADEAPYKVEGRGVKGQGKM